MAAILCIGLDTASYGATYVCVVVNKLDASIPDTSAIATLLLQA
jgi:hypothetical protein